MTEQEQKAFYQMREALDTIIQYNRDHAACQYGDAEKAERWACVVKAREAITAANVVSDMQNCTTEVTQEQREWCLHLHSEKAVKL